MDEANPYLSPLLDPPTLVGGNPTASKVSGDLHTGTDRFKGQNSKERLKQMLSEVSMAEAVQCIAQFLSNDKRYHSSMLAPLHTVVQEWQKM